MVDKRIKLKSIIGLWFQVLFYSLLITALCFIFLPQTRTIKNLALAFLPVVGNSWWYISSYFALFFCIPILNAAISQLSKKTYEKFLLVVLVGICIIECIIPIDAFVFEGGYSAIWLIVLYLFGAYIKKYDLKDKITASKSILGFLVMAVLTFLSKFVIYFATEKILGQAKFHDIFVSYISITIVLASIFMFLFCLNIKINGACQKIIAIFAPTTLGVYLIHVHPLVFRFVIKNAFVSFTNKPVILMVALILISVLAIFVLCAVIDLLRIQLFKLVKVGKLSEAIDNKITSTYSCIFKG